MSRWRERLIPHNEETQIVEIQRPMDEDWIICLRKRNQQLYSNMLDVYSSYQNFILSKLLTFGIVDYNDIKATLNVFVEGNINHKTFRRAYNDAYIYTTKQHVLKLAVRKFDNDNKQL